MTTPLGAGANNGDMARWDAGTSSWVASIGAIAGLRIGLLLGYVDDDTISISPGICGFTDGSLWQLAAATNYTFTVIDSDARAVGRDYAVWATAAGPKFVLITTTASGPPSGYTAANSRLLGYFHNGKDYVVGGGADGAIFQYSVTSNDLLLGTTPYRAHPELAPGIPLPGMVKIGGLAIGIYQASHEDSTAAAAGTSAYPTSRYGVVPWTTISGWDAMAALRNCGCRMPTWEEWLGAVEWNPGSAVPARMNGNDKNTNPPSSTDDAAQTATLDPSGVGNRALCGTGPRTNVWTATKSGRSWYSPAGISDPVGNVWEWVAQFFAGLRTVANAGGSQVWDTSGNAAGYEEGDATYNFLGASCNPDTGGYTDGLPALLGVGGSWSDGAAAGVRSANAYGSPGNAVTGFGFRPGR